MASYKCRYHDEEKSNCEWQDEQEVRVEANKCVGC